MLVFQDPQQRSSVTHNAPSISYSTPHMLTMILFLATLLGLIAAMKPYTEGFNLLADFAVEFVDKCDVDPRHLKPVLVAQRSTAVICHLRPVDADFQVNFRSVSVHGVDESFVKCL